MRRSPVTSLSRFRSAMSFPPMHSTPPSSTCNSQAAGRAQPSASAYTPVGCPRGCWTQPARNRFGVMVRKSPPNRPLVQRPELPEVVDHPLALVDAPEAQLDVHLEVDGGGIAVGELAVEPAPALEVRGHHDSGGIGVRDQVVAGEGEDAAAPGQ